VHKWANAGDNPDDDLIVIQFGKHLRFFKDEGQTISNNDQGVSVDLSPYATVVDVEWWRYPVAMASGNGYLVVTGRYIKPFTVEWENGVPVTTEMQVTIRDFTGYQSDTISFAKQPTELSEEHRYQLRNRGWRDADIEAYFEAEGKYPSLNMLWHKGYAREVDDAVYSTEDGKKSFNPDKLSAEPFGNQSAPHGSLLVDPFDTTVGATAFVNPVAITDIEVADWSSTSWLVTLTTDGPHNLGPVDRFYINGHQVFAEYVEDSLIPGAPPVTYVRILSFDGRRVAWVGREDNTLTFLYTKPDNFQAFQQTISNGALDDAETLVNPEGYTTNERPSACAWYAGRVWMAGTNYRKLADKVMFSQVATNREELANFYQFNDPTNENLNNLLTTDGGVLQLSDIGSVEGLLAYQNVLLVLCDNGVWEISGGRGMFAPDNFFVRKITDARCSSPWGFVEAEGRVMFLGTDGVYVIQPDERTGVLYAVSLTDVKIHAEWQRVAMAAKNIAKMAYDPIEKQVWILTDIPIRQTTETTGPTVHQIAVTVPHSGAPFTELSGDVPVDDDRALFWSTSADGPWTQHPWDGWSNTAVSVTPSSSIPVGNVWWKVRIRSGVESEPVMGTVSAQPVTIPVPEPPQDPVEPIDQTILYQTIDGNTQYRYPSAFVYDVRLDAWHKFQFPRTSSAGVIADIFVTRDSTQCDSFQNVKFVVPSLTELKLCDMCHGTNTTDLYKDWNDTETEAFLLMGPDNIGNWHSFRQAPVVHVHSYATDRGPNLNESSILMRARWDWTDNIATGKWGTEQQVHRRTRPYVPPTLSGWDDGYPVVVTRNKVRGRGRALQLAFRSEPEKDAHLLGYAIRYAVTGRV
jgi:hypothetical protein